jgi:hypothetical protein
MPLTGSAGDGGGVTTTGGRERPPYRWAVVLYDRAYRWVRGLDRPAAEVGPVLRVEVRRNRRARRLADGTRLRHADRIGLLHLDNRRIAAIHVGGRSPLSVGLEFRRQLMISLHVLARLADGGPLGDVVAFSAITIFYDGLARLGFAPDPHRLAWPQVVAAYQRALLASIHPAGALRLNRATYREAQRLWLSRPALVARYGRRQRLDVSRGRGDAS